MLILYHFCPFYLTTAGRGTERNEAHTAEDTKVLTVCLCGQGFFHTHHFSASLEIQNCVCWINVLSLVSVLHGLSTALC